jgi:hypothetical protein
MPKPPTGKKTVSPAPRKQPLLTHVVAGNLFSTFCCLVIGALQFFGIINLILGYVLLFLAGVVGTVLIYTDLIPTGESKHKVAGTCVLWIILIIIGTVVGSYKNHNSPAQTATTNSTGPINSVNGSIIAPGATGPINLTNNSRSSDAELFASQFDELKKVTDLLGGKDEFALRETFDFLRFAIINLKEAKAYVAAETMTPAEWDEIKQFSDGGNVEVYYKYVHLVRPNGGGFRVDQIPGVLGSLILSKKYLLAKQVLLPFETSPQMPTMVQESIKAFDKTVDDDRALLIEVINEKLAQDKNNIILENDLKSPYFGVTNTAYIKRFVPLKPKADDVLAKIRDFLKAS